MSPRKSRISVNKFRLTVDDLKGKQSVRATFRLPQQVIELLTLIAGQLGIKQKSLFDQLIEDSAVLVFKEEVAPLLVAEPVLGLREDVRGIAPDEVRSVAVGDDDAQIAAVHVGSDQACHVSILRLRPAMQHDEALSIRSDEQMIRVML